MNILCVGRDPTWSIKSQLTPQEWKVQDPCKDGMEQGPYACTLWHGLSCGMLHPGDVHEGDVSHRLASTVANTYVPPVLMLRDLCMLGIPSVQSTSDPVPAELLVANRMDHTNS